MPGNPTNLSGGVDIISAVEKKSRKMPVESLLDPISPILSTFFSIHNWKNSNCIFTLSSLSPKFAWVTSLDPPIISSNPQGNLLRPGWGW